MSHANSIQKVQKMVLLAILIALTLVIAVVEQFFPRIGLSITFLSIPMGIAAVMLGPAAGAAIGFVFGFTMLCRSIPILFFGVDLVGVELFQLNWLYTVLICIGTRMIAGWLVGVIANGFRAHLKSGRKLTVREVIGVIAAPLLNTILFLSFLVLFFAGTKVQIGDTSLDIVKNIAVPAISVNAVIEIIVCSVIGIAVCAALKMYTSSSKRR